ncbi:MAG: sulfotransferase [Xanthomonadales bacterium]|nr:sulfotransferase [Xanthomonadales bacterium]
MTAVLAQAHTALAQRDWRTLHRLCTEWLLRDSQAVDPYYLLALLAAEHDNPAKALQVVDRALALAPTRSDCLALRGRCLLALNRPAEALQAARDGVRGDVNDAHTWDTLGVVLTRAGAHDEAVMPYRQAVSLVPGRADFQYNLAAALQFTGELEDAAQAYRRCLTIEAEHPRAWSALSQLAKPPFDDGEWARLQQLATASCADDQPVDSCLHLCHAVAKQLEDQGEPQAAMRWLARGKRRKRTSLGYDFSADAALFDAAGHLDTDAPVGAGHDSEEPIFIVGLPRTGTTLVERILSSHPQVFAAGELSHFSLAAKRLAGTTGAHVLDAATLRAAERTDPAHLGQLYLQSTRPRTGHTAHFIDKMPLNFHYLGLIRRALPRARLICLRRHPLDSILSNYRQLFATGFSYYNYALDLLDCARYWLAFDRLIAHWQAQPGMNLLQLHYEQVVDDLEMQARALLAHCELDWDRRCLDFQHNPAAVATASSVQVRQPLYRSSVGRWRRYADELGPAIDWLRQQGVSLD